MRVPRADDAVISRDKCVGYLLNPSHPEGAGKANFFSGLGFRAEHWEELARALHEVLRHGGDAVRMESPHGTKYIVDGVISTPAGRTASVRTVWIVDGGADSPRFVTAYPRTSEQRR